MIHIENVFKILKKNKKINNSISQKREFMAKCSRTEKEREKAGRIHF